MGTFTRVLYRNNQRIPTKVGPVISQRVGHRQRYDFSSIPTGGNEEHPVIAKTQSSQKSQHLGQK